MTGHHRGPFCQSCGMPLQKASDFGTAVDGLRVNDYCCFCFQDGAFTAPDLTVDAMIERCAEFMGRRGTAPDGATLATMGEFIPSLKRWR